MHTCKHAVGRNLLRIAEIALFFVISVLGYGLLVKVSAFQARQKSRDHAPNVQRSLDMNGLRGKPDMLSGSPTFQTVTATPDAQTVRLHLYHPFYSGISPHRPDHSSVTRKQTLYRNDPDRTPRPYNLLQRSAILIV